MKGLESEAHQFSVYLENIEHTSIPMGTILSFLL
jgi:hypothetical protein